MENTKYLILGAGPASSWAVRGIRQEDSEGDITKYLILGARDKAGR